MSFAGGVFSAELKGISVRHSVAPIYHPSFVQHAKSVVQIRLQGLQAALQDNPSYILQWDTYVKPVILKMKGMSCSVRLAKLDEI